MKPLKDLDKGHPFYSDKAIRAAKLRMKELEEQERLMAKKSKVVTEEEKYGLREVTRSG